MVDRVLTLPAGTPPGRPRARSSAGARASTSKLFFDLRRQGFVRVRVDGQLRELAEDIELDKKKKHTIEVVVDRLVVKRHPRAARLADSLETALRLARRASSQVEVPDGGPAFVFSERLACAACGISFPEISPRMFSFNNPYGACPDCGGLGTPLRDRSRAGRAGPEQARWPAGALAPWAGRDVRHTSSRRSRVLAKRHGFAPRDAVGEAAEEDRAT